jgi:glycosyltransferase involved in cell wall biosynthesis
VKLACVVHRYGADIAGGSEAHCRQLAERLAARQHDVTVLTSCARDYVTWSNAYPAAESHAGGVRLIRFPVRRPRRLKRFADLSDEVFDSHAPPSRQEEWFRENGPDVPGLLEHLRRHGPQYDLVLFWSYRYATAYFGLPLVADRAVLVPTAEEDPAIALEVLEAYFRQPAGFLFLTPEEEWLVARRAGRAVGPSAIIGAGLDPAVPPSPGPLPVEEPYVLYLGRVDRNKGCATLFEYARAALDDRGPVTLVLAGPARMPVPVHPRIRALGFVNDALRDRLLAHASALVVPSPYESLSLALLEGWNHGVPALVNGECRVLAGQVRRANGGLYYRSAREFATALEWLLAHPAEARTLGAQGLHYVDREYRWPVVLERVEGLLDRVRAGRP